jgi:hypothetical protein
MKYCSHPYCKTESKISKIQKSSTIRDANASVFAGESMMKTERVVPIYWQLKTMFYATQFSES